MDNRPYSNNNSEAYIYNIDWCTYKNINLWIVLDKFLESTLFCRYIWSLDQLSYDAKNFLIYFIKKQKRIDTYTPEQVVIFYREVLDRLCISHREVSMYIPFFWKFLSEKSVEFQNNFITVLNKELREYIHSIFEIHFQDKKWPWYEFIKRRNSPNTNNQVQAILW